MHSSRFATAAQVRMAPNVLAVVALVCLLLASAAYSGVPAARAASVAPVPLKAVIIVGPTNAMTDSNLADAEQLALVAEEYGMDVRRVFFPHATWDNVLANIQGANLVVYMGHGYGWPSPYTKVLTESRQNGMGLNSFDGSGKNQYTYYGANLLRANVVLAPNSIVFLNHLCYSAGNGEPGTAVPSWDVARQRVDNMASGWLAAGARAVFAYSSQLFPKSLRALFTSDQTMEQIFRIPGSKPKSYFGWIGWDARKFDSVRTVGAQNFLDPEPTVGFYRAITGDLAMTASEWAQGQGGDTAPPPVLTDLSASAASGGSAVASGDPEVFTPNGDGVTDELMLTFTVDSEAFVDFSVSSGSDVVRTFSSWSPAGPGQGTWDGKRDNGNWVGDGMYTITATPRNRAGTAGTPSSVEAQVLTTMRAPSVAPDLFYAADGDGLAPTTTLSVNLDRQATFSWKIVDAGGGVVRSYMNNANTAPGPLTWVWDGRDKDGAFVPQGTYFSVMTAATGAGTYSHRLPLDARAFRLTSSVAAPFVRGTKAKIFIASAEPLIKKPRLKLYAPGVTVKTYGTYNWAAGGYYVTVTFPAAASAGTVQLKVFGFDTANYRQETVYSFPLL